MQMVFTVEDYRTEDGLTVPHLRHLKCNACNERFFDDEAMHCIQAERDRLHWWAKPQTARFEPTLPD
jgi:hypothetical protein